MSDAQVYCPICGGPVLGDCYGYEDYMTWLKDAILLTTAHKTDQGTELDAYWAPWPPRVGEHPFDLGPTPPEESQRFVLRQDAVSSEGSTSFVVSGTGECVNVMVVDLSPLLPSPDHGGSLHLPVHRSCLQLADRFVVSTKTSLAMAIVPPNGVTSILNLWEILYRRLPGSVNGRRTFNLPELHDYFGGQRCRNVYWEPEDDSEHGLLHEQNPLDIPDLTRLILQNLVPAPSASEGAATNQDWYLSALLNQELLPWLWDLDPDLVLEKQQSGSWDWKALVTQLTVPTIHEPRDMSVDIPLALRNRRRIWRLLEEARVNDYMELQEQLNDVSERVRKDEREKAKSLQELRDKYGPPGNPLGVPGFGPRYYGAPGSEQNER